MSESLWPKIEEVSNDNNTLDILKEQSYIISDQTKGKIKCFFGRIQYNIPDMSTVEEPPVTFTMKLFVTVTYTYSMFFPNTLDIDDGICEELNLSHSISINSNEELENYLKDIFSSKSVRTALKMMMQ